jgi:hypothetical protein
VAQTFPSRKDIQGNKKKKSNWEEIMNITFFSLAS